MSRILAACAMVLVSALALPVPVQAQPAKTTRIVIGYPPGGGIDYTGRLIAERLNAVLGQPVVVENRGGAGGQIAADYVSHAEPDGRTLFFAVGSDLVWTKFLTKKKTIDPLKDLTPIATSIQSVNCIVVSAASPYKTFQDLVDYGKKNPGKLSYGTSGVQSYYYLIGELLKQNGLDMLHVPYQGTAPIMTAMLGGEINVGLLTVAITKPQAETGKARILAVFGPKRYAGLPDIPAINEILPGFNAPLSWFGFFGPPGMPQPVAAKLNQEITRALQSPEISEKIKALNLEPLTMPFDQLRPFILQTTEVFSHVITTAGIKPLD